METCPPCGPGTPDARVRRRVVRGTAGSPLGSCAIPFTPTLPIDTIPTDLQADTRRGEIGEPQMEVTTTPNASTREEWRSWLLDNHGAAPEIWLIYDDRPTVTTVAYLDSVEEAICFGWIDGIQKRISPFEKAQRFSPRRPRSNWTELDEERARRLLRLGRMTDAGIKALPDLDQPIVVPGDILSAVGAEAGAWRASRQFPDLFVRVRIGCIEEMRKRPEEFERRLNHFLCQTAAGRRFGNWNEDGRLL